MTLQLKLTNQSGFSGSQFIYVKGGQAGVLRLNTKRLPQTIKCSSKDHLTLLIAGKDSQFQPNNVISVIQMHAQAIIDAHQIQLRQNDQVEYRVRGYDESDNKKGELTFTLKYDRKRLYTGEMVGADKQRAQYLPFYKAKCPSYNLYNCLDKKSAKAKFVGIEEIYRDE